MKRIYISGAITGRPDIESRYHFNNAEKLLQKRGYAVVNPKSIDSSLSVANLAYDEYMKVDLVLLEMCEVIYMLKGYEKSKGAMIELNRAKELGIEIMYEQKQAT